MIYREVHHAPIRMPDPAPRPRRRSAHRNDAGVATA